MVPRETPGKCGLPAGLWGAGSPRPAVGTSQALVVRLRAAQGACGPREPDHGVGCAIMIPRE